MKIIIVSVFLLLPAVVFASKDPVAPYVKKRTTGPSVAPKYRNRTECTIDAKQVIITKTKGLKKPSVTTKDVKWSKAVEDGAKLKELLTDASHGVVYKAKCLPPVGGSVTYYTGVLKSEDEAVDLGSNPCRSVNSAPEAKTLMEFIEENCD